MRLKNEIKANKEQVLATTTERNVLDSLLGKVTLKKAKRDSMVSKIHS